MSRRGSNCKKCKVYFSTCIHCGQIFSARTSLAACCVPCRKTRERLYNAKERRLVDLTCQQCGCSYQRPWTDVRAERKNLPDKPEVCSGRCLSLFRGTKVERPCDHCGKLVFRNKREVDKYQFLFCSKQCEGESYLHRKTGEAHYRFKDGRSSLSYGLGWTLARQRTRKRDNYTCQDCGITEKQYGKKLDVHHIIPFRDFDDSDEANKLTNLISFCAPCHHRIEVEQLKDPEVTVCLLAMVG